MKDKPSSRHYILILVAMLFIIKLPNLAGIVSAAGANEGWTIRYIDDGKWGKEQGADGTDLFDVDKDGDMDIVAAWEESARVRIYTNLGTGRTWGTKEICSNCISVEGAHFADIDNDGNVDVVSAHESLTTARGKIKIHWAPKSLNEKWISKDVGGSSKALWLVSDSGQIDGKNGIDIVAGTKKTKKSGVYLFEAPANPRATSEWKIFKIANATWVMSLILNDIDNDGDLDVIFSDRERGVLWLENPGNGVEIKSNWKEHLIGTGINVRFFIMDDIDSDGLEDIVLADGTDTSAVTWFKKPDDLNQNWEAYYIGFLPGIAWSTMDSKAVAVGDIDADGKKDIVVTTEADGHRVYWLSYQDSVFDAQWKSSLIFDEFPAKFDLVHLVDLDNDGDLDVLTSEEKRLGVIWFENLLNE